MQQICAREKALLSADCLVKQNCVYSSTDFSELVWCTPKLHITNFCFVLNNGLEHAYADNSYDLERLAAVVASKHIYLFPSAHVFDYSLPLFFGC